MEKMELHPPNSCGLGSETEIGQRSVVNKKEEESEDNHDNKVRRPQAGNAPPTVEEQQLPMRNGAESDHRAVIICQPGGRYE